MNPLTPRSWRKGCKHLVAAGCAALLLPGQGYLLAQATTPAAPAATPPADAAVAPAPEEPKLSGDQLESLVAPIALYPDTLLAQALVASTYPLEIVQLQQWLQKHPDLKDQALTDAVAKEPWDDAIKGMATIPDLVKRLADDIQWTTELGNAFLAQQSDVMDAVQRMRKKAQDKGTLTSNEQQKVETQVVAEKTVIVVQPADPTVVYVPSYNPTVVYPPPVYSYPPVYYPPPGQAFMTFSIGVAVGAAFWGGGCGWGGNDVYIDRDTDINIDRGDRNNINTGDRGNRGDGNRTSASANSRSGGKSGGKSTWSHDSSHRGAAPYSNKATADKFGGSTSGRGQASAASRGSGAGATARSASAPSRGASPSASTRSSAGASRGASPSASSRTASAASSRGGSSGYNMGSRDFSSSSSSRSGGFGGGSSGFSGSGSRASSSRGASSFGGRGGGGGRRR